MLVVFTGIFFFGSLQIIEISPKKKKNTEHKICPLHLVYHHLQKISKLSHFCQHFVPHNVRDGELVLVISDELGIWIKVSFKAYQGFMREFLCLYGHTGYVQILHVLHIKESLFIWREFLGQWAFWTLICRCHWLLNIPTAWAACSVITYLYATSSISCYNLGSLWYSEFQIPNPNLMSWPMLSVSNVVKYDTCY